MHFLSTAQVFGICIMLLITGMSSEGMARLQPTVIGLFAKISSLTMRVKFPNGFLDRTR